MATAETVLAVYSDRGRRGLPLEGVYRQLFRRDLYLRAYGRIYRNDGTMPPGVTGETVDAMSLAKIDRIIDVLRREAYGIAYLAAFRLQPTAARVVLFMLFAAPFLVNYIVRTFAWAGILSRNGFINSALMAIGIIDQPMDWLLFSDFAVYLGLITAYMPFMIFPIWLSLATIDRRYLEASWLLGAPPFATFWRVTMPLSLPGMCAALIFGLVGCFGEVAISLILGGTGYQLFGNVITSAIDVLNYPLAAAMAMIAVLIMLALLLIWFRYFDLRLFLGKIVGRARSGRLAHIEPWRWSG